MGRKGDYIYLLLHSHHQNDFCIKVDSDERHFNVSLIVRDTVTRQCPQITTLEEKGEPKRIRTDVMVEFMCLVCVQWPSGSAQTMGACFFRMEFMYLLCAFHVPLILPSSGHETT